AGGACASGIAPPVDLMFRMATAVGIAADRHADAYQQRHAGQRMLARAVLRRAPGRAGAVQQVPGMPVAVVPQGFGPAAQGGPAMSATQMLATQFLQRLTQTRQLRLDVALGR